MSRLSGEALREDPAMLKYIASRSLVVKNVTVGPKFSTLTLATLWYAVIVLVDSRGGWTTAPAAPAK